MKKIGILGGMGPESTAVFYLKIIGYCQRKYCAKYDSDYPEIFIYSLPIPDIVEGIKSPEEIVPMLRMGMGKLETSGAEFIAIPCNTVHYYYDDMKKAVKIPVLNIIEETGKKAKLLGLKKVGLLATKTTIETGIYSVLARKFRIKLVIPEQQKEINEIIMNILEGKKLEADKNKIAKVNEELQKSEADGIVLGCTDLPTLIKQKDLKIPILDTIEILAEATVKLAYGENQKAETKRFK